MIGKVFAEVEAVTAQVPARGDAMRDSAI
jgi:hypothetical protein